MTDKSRQLAEAFLAVAPNFKLGHLPTEQRHPETKDLADLSRSDLAAAFRLLQKIDVAALDRLAEKETEIRGLSLAIAETFDHGGRVFFYGCGATGRLALSIEQVWRREHARSPDADRVIGFMSGGDLALVHSIENFEDHPEYGARQVREIGFGVNDLLVSCTEGGETPSVIGATEEAARISRRKPWFLYCNPDDSLRGLERSREVLENPGIEKICLAVGPMSLSGSTRLQATTVLQLAAGSALFGRLDLAAYADFVRAADYTFLTPFVEAESAAYEAKEFFLYESSHYAMTVLTDTTERSPTFSLPGFENQGEPRTKPSLAYLMLPGTRGPEAAWRQLLLREPRALEWEELQGVAGKARLRGFDFSENVAELREKKLDGATQRHFRIERTGARAEFTMGELNASTDVGSLHPLLEQLWIKMLLNAHSLLVMGRIGRFESNVMTWVKPSNNKLVDRSIRYVEFLLEREGVRKVAYNEICYQLFEDFLDLHEGESVVLKTVAALKARHARSPLSGSGPAPGSKKPPLKAAAQF